MYSSVIWYYTKPMCICGHLPICVYAILYRYQVVSGSIFFSWSTWVLTDQIWWFFCQISILLKILSGIFKRLFWWCWLIFPVCIIFIKFSSTCHKLFSNAQGTIMSNNHILADFRYFLCNMWYVRAWEMKLWGSVYPFFSENSRSNFVHTGMMGWWCPDFTKYRQVG